MNEGILYTTYCSLFINTFFLVIWGSGGKYTVYLHSALRFATFLLFHSDFIRTEAVRTENESKISSRNDENRRSENRKKEFLVFGYLKVY